MAEAPTFALVAKFCDNKSRGRGSTLFMPYRNQQFVNGEIYHITLRGIDDNLMFKDTNDYYRGIFSVYEFNDINPTTIQKRREARIRFKEGRGRGSTFFADADDKREKLVEVLAFCFMPNHIHLFVKQLKEGGIEKFMRKVGTGYAGYFNRKYSRKGYVFQNRFSAVHIKDNNQLKIVFTYIHTNPVALIYPRWKEMGIKNAKKAIDFLKNYKWSSHQDYIGKKNFPSITERQFVLDVIGGEQGCRDSVANWLKYKQEIQESQRLFLEDFGD